MGVGRLWAYVTAWFRPVSSSGAVASVADLGEKFVGTWTLVGAVSEDLATGQKTNIYKGAPAGFINFAADGRFLVMAIDSSRTKPAGESPSHAEAAALFRTMMAYAGSYTVKDSQVINHVDISWNEGWTGTDQMRNFKFDGERLHLSTAPSPNPFTGQLSIRTLSWDRFK